MCCDLNTIKMSGKITYHGTAKSLPDFPTKGSSLPVLTQNQRSQKGPASGRTARLQEGRCIKGPGQGHKNLNIADFCVKKFLCRGSFLCQKSASKKGRQNGRQKRILGHLLVSPGSSGSPVRCPGVPQCPRVPKNPKR